ncbi:hypothetical protein SAMN02982996_00760 [Lonsdalea quercina]|uniref:Uncharacterized protein n=1 Tax=Lonsdalea quercina TaxID=71657 RepID=A0A1H3XSN4_9GAMM|nr:hypothetical protein SAMN02982996_00760 [Lonsdalea quercina]
MKAPATLPRFFNAFHIGNIQHTFGANAVISAPQIFLRGRMTPVSVNQIIIIIFTNNINKSNILDLLCLPAYVTVQYLIGLSPNNIELDRIVRMSIICVFLRVTITRSK